MASNKQSGKSAETKNETPKEQVEWKELAKTEIGQQGNLTLQVTKVDKIVNGQSEGIYYTLSKVGKRKGGDDYRAQLLSVTADLAPAVLAPSVIEALNPKTDAAEPKAAPKRPSKPKAAPNA